MPDELDKDLQAIFRKQNQSLREEPFLTTTRALVEKHRSRRIYRKNLSLLLIAACCALLSRFLIQGSILLSGYLDWIFAAAGMLLSKPAGTFAAVFCCAILLLIFRRRLMATLV
jgi:hypothetical protein